MNSFFKIAILKNEFTKKREFVRFAKSKLSTTKNGKLEVEVLKGQESFRIKSFVKSNIWVLLPAGKSKFKKGIKQSRNYGHLSTFKFNNPEKLSGMIVCCPEERRFSCAIIDDRAMRL